MVMDPETRLTEERHKRRWSDTLPSALTTMNNPGEETDVNLIALGLCRGYEVCIYG